MWWIGVAVAAPEIWDEPTESAATVLIDRLRIDADGDRLTQTREWTVRIDDPVQVQAGLIAPDGLDNAKNGGAQILENVLLLPSGVTSGDTFSFKKTQTVRRSGHAATFSPAPDLPVQRAELLVDAKSRLTLWTEESGETSFPTAGRQQIVWTMESAQHSTLAAWSTWPDWFAAGEALNSEVSRQVLPKAESYGRALASDLSGVNPAQVWQRVRREVKLQPEPSTWRNMRPAQEVLSSGQGTASERGLILLGLLRIAGFDAQPACYSTDVDPDMPWSLPNPGLVDQPTVVVRHEGRTLWIDPSSEAGPSEEPSESGVWWELGDLPHPRQHTAVPEAQVQISSQGTLEVEGGATWTATLTASGEAEQALRDTLRPLTETQRTELFKRLLAIGHPQIDRWKIDWIGLEDQRPLKISIQAHEIGVLSLKKPVLHGALPALLAPALAEWLPMRVKIHEELSLTWPSDYQPLSLLSTDSAWHSDGALLYRSRAEGARTILETTAIRRKGYLSPGREEAIDAFFVDNARSGWSALALQQSAKVSKENLLETSLFMEGEATAVASLAAGESPKKAAKKLLAAGPAAVKAYSRYPSADTQTLMTVLLKARTDELRLTTGTALLERGQSLPEGVLESVAVGPDPAAAVQASALLYRSAPEHDRLRWLEAARSAAAALPNSPELTRIELAEALRQNDTPKLRETLPALEGQKAEDQLLRLETLLALNEPRDTLREALEVALTSPIGIRGIPPAELIRAAELSLQLEDPEQAIDLAFAAATLEDSANTWFSASKIFVLAGDLRGALGATQRASALAPNDPAIATQLAQFGAFALDEPSMRLGLSRGNLSPIVAEWPPSLAELVTIADPAYLLALLEFHDETVITNAKWVGLRAQLRLDQRQMDGVVRDGSLLWKRFKDPRGIALAFAGGAGRVQTSVGLDQLDKSEPLHQAVRLEYQLITGFGNAASSAKANADSPRERILLDALASNGAASETWPATATEPGHPSPGSGWKANAVLGSALGVVAWSDTTRHRSVLISSVPGVLPPPLEGLYTQEKRPLQRLSDGAQIFRLSGGVLPVFAAIRELENGRVIGLGLTEAAAAQAVAKIPL